MKQRLTDSGITNRVGVMDNADFALVFDLIVVNPNPRTCFSIELLYSYYKFLALAHNESFPKDPSRHKAAHILSQVQSPLSSNISIVTYPLSLLR